MHYVPFTAPNTYLNSYITYVRMPFIKIQIHNLVRVLFPMDIWHCRHLIIGIKYGCTDLQRLQMLIKA